MSFNIELMEVMTTSEKITFYCNSGNETITAGDTVITDIEGSIRFTGDTVHAILAYLTELSGTLNLNGTLDVTIQEAIELLGRFQLSGGLDYQELINYIGELRLSGQFDRIDKILVLLDSYLAISGEFEMLEGAEVIQMGSTLRLSGLFEYTKSRVADGHVRRPLKSFKSTPTRRGWS